MSDKHCPIELTVNTSIKLPQEASTRIEDEHNTKKTTTKCKWDDNKKEDYKMSFDEAKITGMLNTLSNINISTVTQDSMEIIAADLKEAFLLPAEATGMLKQQISGKKVCQRIVINPGLTKSAMNPKITIINLRKL